MREVLLMRKCSRTVPGKKKNPVNRSDVKIFVAKLEAKMIKLRGGMPIRALPWAVWGVALQVHAGVFGVCVL